MQDEIVILFDGKNGSVEVLDYVLGFNKLPNVQTWRSWGWNGNFSDWKNKLNDYCLGDYIFQLDTDEMITKNLIDEIHNIISNTPQFDLIYVPRKNTVDGITDEHLSKWKWEVDYKGWINAPNYQGRVYRKGLKWEGKIHEKIVSKNGIELNHCVLNEDLFIDHHKTIEKQEYQNKRFFNM